MKFKQLSALAGLSMVTAPMMASISMAAPSGFSTHKDSKGAVYFGGVNSGEVIVSEGNVPKTKNLKVNACGQILVKGSTTSPIPATFTVGSTTITVANLPTQINPKCNTTTGALEEARTADFKTSDGTVVLVGKTANSSVVMNYLASVSKKVKMNACGFGKISNSTTKPFAADATFTPAGGSSMTYSSIPVKAPYICGKDGTTYAPQAAGS